jgi:glutamate-1-semialdehyde 2,1-aminomutase
MLLLPFQHEHAFDLIEENAGDLAVVMVEPVLHGYGMPFDPAFLARLREVTRRCGVLLMFDEVVTKFRMGISGGEGYFGVTPDLVAFGKAIGGGLPVGAVGFRAEVIEPVTTGRETVELGGTFSGNALTVTAGNAMLDHLLEHPEIYPELSARGDTLRDEFNGFAARNGFPASMLGVGSLFRAILCPGPMSRPRDAFLESARLVRDFHLLLRLQGVFAPYPIRTCYFSAAHTDADLEFVITAHQTALRECMEMNRERIS